MTERVFQVSDLANHRTEFIDEARSGGARLRDKDGTSLVMLPESRLLYLQRLNDLTRLHGLLSVLQTSSRSWSAAELGEYSWLRVFDSGDLLEFGAELAEAVAAARGDEDTVIADEVVAAWRTTSKQLADPLRSSVLLGTASADDFVEATRPEGPDLDKAGQ